MKLGIGITTAGKRRIRIDNYTMGVPEGTLVHVYTDADREGPAKAKNKCMHALYEHGCDVMYLFDDDCYPVYPGWHEYLLRGSDSSGIQFFGLPEVFKGKWIGSQGEVARWETILGCFQFQTRKLLETVGYYNNAYVGYGLEDVARNIRIMRSGLVGDTPGAPSLVRLPSYIRSEDVFGVTEVQNLTMEEKLKFIEKNNKIFAEEANGAQLYYPFG